MIWILWILWSEFSYVLCQPCQTGLFMRSAFASQCYYDGASGQGESASQSQRLRGKPWVQCIGNVYMYMQMRVSNFCGLLSQHGFFWVYCVRLMLVFWILRAMLLCTKRSPLWLLFVAWPSVMRGRAEMGTCQKQSLCLPCSHWRTQVCQISYCFACLHKLLWYYGIMICF